MPSKGLAYQAFPPISRHRIPNLPRYREAQTAEVEVALTAVNDEYVIRYAHLPLKDTTKLGANQQSHPFGKRGVTHRHAADLAVC